MLGEGEKERLEIPTSVSGERKRYGGIESNGF